MIVTTAVIVMSVVNVDIALGGEVLSGFWSRIGERPNLDGFDASTGGRNALRAGVLTGIIGSSRQIAKAQK